MSIATQQIINLLSTIANDEQMRITVTQCVRGGLIAGGMAVAGGLIGGPIGLAVGSCVAAATSAEFLSVAQVLAKMEPERQEHLAENVRQIMGNVGVADVAVFAGMLTGSVALRNEVVNALVSFLQNEMKMVIAN